MLQNIARLVLLKADVCNLKKKKTFKKSSFIKLSNEIAKTKTCYIHFKTYVTMELYKLSHRLNISMREATSELNRFKHYRGQTMPPRHS